MRRAPYTLFAAIVAAALLGSGCGLRALHESHLAAEAGPTLRVLLDASAREARLTSEGSLDAEPASGARRAYPSGVLILARSGALLLVDLATGEETNAGPDVLVIAPDGAPIRVNGTTYRGAIAVTPVGAKGVRIVNHVATEDYLLGVIPAEIGRRADEEIDAVKAQAVAARTYALSSLGQYGPAGFDLYATVQDQVYSGVAGEEPVATRAVRESAGLVLMSRGVLARAYYCSTCGGRTATVSEVWDKPPASYLRSQADRSGRRGGGTAFCSASPTFAWTEEWSALELDEVLARYLPGEAGLAPGTAIGHLTGVRALERGRSGRVLDLEFTTTTGRYVVSGDRIRWVLRRTGARDAILRSTLFRIERVEKLGGRVRRLVIAGRGNGHGVGMCQTGAIGMAQLGYSFRDILRHYYRGADVRAFTEARGLPVALSGRDVVRRILVWTGPASDGFVEPEPDAAVGDDLDSDFVRR